MYAWAGLGSYLLGCFIAWLGAIRHFVREEIELRKGNPSTGDLLFALFFRAFFGLYAAAFWPLAVAGYMIYQAIDRTQLLHRLFGVGEFRKLTREEQLEQRERELIAREQRIKEMEDEVFGETVAR